MPIVEFILSLVGQTEAIHMKRFKVKEIIDMLKVDGWFIHSHKGTSHRQFKHPVKKGKVTVNGKSGDTLSQELLNRLYKHAGGNSHPFKTTQNEKD